MTAQSRRPIADHRLESNAEGCAMCLAQTYPGYGITVCRYGKQLPGLDSYSRFPRAAHREIGRPADTVVERIAVSSDEGQRQPSGCGYLAVPTVCPLR